MRRMAAGGEGVSWARAVTTERSAWPSDRPETRHRRALPAYSLPIRLPSSTSPSTAQFYASQARMGPVSAPVSAPA